MKFASTCSINGNENVLTVVLKMYRYKLSIFSPEPKVEQTEYLTCAYRANLATSRKEHN
jgi:hypothetical protein